jgi:hypothetical protein
MSNAGIILQIMLITLGMIIFGMILNILLGLSREKMAEFKEQALSLRERIRNAQVIGDMQMMAQVQRETLQFTKKMMVRQFVPLCVRCFIFIGIFAILQLFYAEYNKGLLPFPILFFGDGWIALYFVFSISFSLIIFGIRKLYKRYTGKDIATQSNLREIMELVSPTRQSSGISFQASSTTNPNIEENTSKKTDSWKDRIEK